MSYNRSHTCIKDADIYIVKNINEKYGKKLKISKTNKTSKNFDCLACYNECNACSCDIGYISCSSGDDQEFSKNLFIKPNKINKSGFVDKVSLRKELVKSSPCLEHIKLNKNKSFEITDLPRLYKKKILEHLSKYSAEDDIDIIPVRLVSSDKTFLFKSNDILKMNSARQSLNPRSDKKVNSWGRILKEQNSTIKDRKITTTSQNAKQKSSLGAVVKNPVNMKERIATNYEVPIPQSRVTSRSKPPVTKDNHQLAKKKLSHHSLKFESPCNGTEYCSDSGTSITGESIMLVDRSAQCSTTNVDGPEPNSWCNPINDVNQAGDSGLAFLNPVRTLNFLVRELRGKLSEGSEDDNMSRIIRDMENTIGRLSQAPLANVKDNWNTIISEDDLKAVLELLQNTPKININADTDKYTTELHQKLGGTCSKLEELCKQLEKATFHILKEDKQRVVSELKLKKSELEAANSKLDEQEQIIAVLKKKNEEQSKQIASLKENQTKTAALNVILNEQLHDTEKKYQQIVTEMQFLILEKEKNVVLMKCKDQDLQEMRKNLEEIKSLVVQHLSSFQLETTNSGTVLGKERKLDFDDTTLMSTLSTTVLNKNLTEIKRDLPVCSSPVETLSPSPDEDESWRKISDVPLKMSDSNILSTNQCSNVSSIVTDLKSNIPLQQQESKTACIKQSLKNLFDEMKKQTKLGTNLSLHNVITLDDTAGMTNWSDLDASDDDIRSGTGYAISESGTNRSK